MSLIEDDRTCNNCGHIGVSGLDMPCSACLEEDDPSEYWEEME